jgi:hypothetical protein
LIFAVAPFEFGTFFLVQRESFFLRRDTMRKHSPDNRDLDAKAIDALVEADKLPPGPERAAALEKATKLRHAAETYKYLFSGELQPPK